VVAVAAFYDFQYSRGGGPGWASKLSTGLLASIKVSMNNRIEWKLVGVAGLALAMRAQSATAPTPKFEAASIRPCDGSQPLPASSPGRLTVGCSPLAYLILQAYAPRDANGRRISPPLDVRVEGGPGWINSDRYAINAKAADGTSQVTMRGPMMQVLLEDRFKLKLHRETRDIPAYALTVSNSDAKLRKLEERGCVVLDTTNPFEPAKPPEPGQKPTCKGLLIGGSGQTQIYTAEAEGVTLDQLSGLYGIAALDRPVINRTGVTGSFSFRLQFVADEATNRFPLPAGGAPTATASDSGPSIFTALEEQLGLKLESTKGPAQFLIIESVERPSEN
jgi:uncharacterized protein (TIGR03435 family)